MSDSLPSHLRTNASDRAASFLRSFTSVVDLHAPGLGSLFGELIGVVIPSQREDRLAEYIVKLATKYSRLSTGIQDLTERVERAEMGIEDAQEVFQQIARGLNAEQVALFEDGARLAVRSTTSDRIDRIAGIVANGILPESESLGDDRSIMTLLEQVSDEDIIVLCSYFPDYAVNQEWQNLHEDVLQPALKLLGQSDRGEPVWNAAAYDAEARRELQLQRLIALGLIEVVQTAEASDNRRNSRPLHVTLKKRPPGLSFTGRYLLKKLGLIEA